MVRAVTLLTALHLILTHLPSVHAQYGSAIGFRGVGSGGSAHRGGAMRSDGPPYGIFLDGSTLPGLNGVYGPRSSSGEDSGVPDYHDGIFYHHDNSGWVLARVSSEWILVDPSLTERFVQDGYGDEPEGGLAWSFKNTDDEEVPDEAELPWLVGGLPNEVYFEQILAKQRKTDTAVAEALRLGTPPETLPGVSKEVAPPDGSCPENDDGWPAAEALLLSAHTARLARDFTSADRDLDAALATHPRYLAALEERGKVSLDAGRFAEASERFAAVFAVDSARPNVLALLIRAATAVERERRAPLRRGIDECEEMYVGSNVGAEAERDVLSSPEFRCPGVVNKTNWLGDDGYDDTFTVTQEEGSTRIVVRREAEMGVSMTHGWGMDLKFSCCKEALPVAEGEDTAPVNEEEKEAARRMSVDHFQVLGLPCDYSKEDLKAAYRTASIQLHPDRPGGSTELFARASVAHECLSESYCRDGWERGDDLPVRQGGDGGSVASQVERRFFPERFPHHPFGDPFARGRPNMNRGRITGTTE